MQSRTQVVLSGGLYAGLLGYGVVVVLCAAANVMMGHSPFYTAAVLGESLFYGVHDPAALVVAPGPVLAYNMVHMVVFLGLGLLASWLVTEAEQVPLMRYVGLFALIFVGVHLFGALLLLAAPMMTTGGLWLIGATGLAAAGVMGWYLWYEHPVLRRQLRDIPVGFEADDDLSGSPSP